LVIILSRREGGRVLSFLREPFFAGGGGKKKPVTVSSGKGKNASVIEDGLGGDGEAALPVSGGRDEPLVI